MGNLYQYNFRQIFRQCSKAPDKRAYWGYVRYIFFIFQQKRILWPLMITVSTRRFQWWVTKYVLWRNVVNFPHIIPVYPFLSGTLIRYWKSMQCVQYDLSRHTMLKTHWINIDSRVASREDTPSPLTFFHLSIIKIHLNTAETKEQYNSIK